MPFPSSIIVEIVLGLLVTAAGTLYGLLAAWVILGSVRASWRWFILAVAITLPLRISADEVFLAHAVQVLAVVSVWLLCALVCQLWSRRRGQTTVANPTATRYRPWRFSLREILLAMAAIGLAVDNSRNWRPRSLALDPVVVGSALALATLTAMIIAGGPWRIGWRLLAVALLGLVLGGILNTYLIYWSDLSLWASASDFMFSPLRRVWPIIVPLICVFVLIGLALTRLADEHESSAPWKSYFRWSYRSVAVPVTCILLLAPWYLMLCMPLAPIDQSPPSPNSFDGLRKIGQQLNATTIDSTTATKAELMTYWATYGMLLDEAALLIRKPFLVRVDYSEQLATPELSDFRELARGLRAIARLAELEQRHEDATNHYMDLIEFGTQIPRGGLWVHAMVGSAFEGMGQTDLVRQLRTQQPADFTQLIARLAEIEQRREPIENNDRVEEGWGVRFLGWWGRLTVAIGKPLGTYPEPAIVESVHNAVKLRSASLRLLISDLAIEAFRNETGRLPKTLAELCPIYLVNVAEDPFASSSLVYRPEGEQYLLYSIGPNRTDDGGEVAPFSEAINRGDLLLEGMLLDGDESRRSTTNNVVE